MGGGPLCLYGHSVLVIRHTRDRHTTLHYTTLHYTKLHYTTLHYTTLHYTTLHYPTLHYNTIYYATIYCTLPLDSLNHPSSASQAMVWVLDSNNCYCKWSGLDGTIVLKREAFDQGSGVWGALLPCP